MKHLSKGQRARTGLVLALAHRPELLVLDEPSSGLDPIVRRDILGAIIRTIAEEGRTVLFSSHLLHEVERVADRVALIDRRPGRLQRCARPHQGHPPPPDAALPRTPPAAAGAGRRAGVGGRGAEWIAVCNGELDALRDAATACGAQVVNQRVPSLDEIFVARVGSRE